MKHKRFTKQLLLTGLMVMMACMAKSQTGQSFYYDDLAYIITSEELKTVAMTDKWTEITPFSTVFHVEIYAGAVTIPSTVPYNGNQYTVNEITESALEKSKIKELTIPETIDTIKVLPGSTLIKLTIEDGDRPIIWGKNGSSAGGSSCKEWYIGRNMESPNVSLSSEDISPLFECFASAESVIIGDKVTKLYPHQFEGYQQNLKTLILGNGLEVIPAYLCSGCFNLTDVAIPSSVKKIEDGAFSDCYGIRNISIPANVEMIGSYIFYRSGASYPTSFTTFTIEDSDTPLTINSPIGTVMFCDSINSLYVGRNLTYEGQSVIFSGNVYHAVIGDKVTEINYRMFCDVDSVDIGINVWKIGNYAFSQSDGLKSIVIPNATKSIGDNAFNMCHNLSSVILNEGLQEIGQSVFSETALEEITIPSTVTTIGKNALGAFTNYRKLMFADSDEPLDFTMRNSIDSLYIGRDINGSFFNAVHVVMGDKVTTVPDYMFATGKVESVFLGNKIASIGKYAFQSCPITKIEIPANVKYIDDYAFAYCHHLKNLILNEGLDSIGMHAFNACSIESLRLPGSLKKVKQEAFKNFNTPIKELIIADSEEPLLLECISPGYYALPTQAENVYIGRDLVNYSNDYYGALSLWNTSELVFGEKVTTLQDIELGNNTTIQTITAPWNTPIAIEDNTFNQTVYDNATLLTTNASIPAYASATGWKNFSNIKAFSYNILAETTKGGKLSLLGQDVTAEQPLSTTVKTGTDIDIVVSAEEGYRLSTLTINEVDKTAEIINDTLYVKNLGEDIEVKAVFEKQTFPITLFVAEGGSLAVGEQTTEEGKTMTLVAQWGDSIEVIISEGEDYELETVTINGNDATELVIDGKLPINDVREAQYIVAVFKQSVFKHLRITDGLRYVLTENFTTRKFTYKRTFDNDAWDILVLPVSLKYEDWEDVLDIAYIYDVNIYDRNKDGQVDYTEIEAVNMGSGSETQANYPYFVRSKNVGDVIIERGETEVSAPEDILLECANTVQTIQICGCYEGLSADEMVNGGLYALQNGVWRKAESDSADLDYMRAFLKVENKNGSYATPADAPEIYIRFVDVESINTIETISYENNVDADKNYYNLSGLRVNDIKTGVYIHQGKKIVKIK